MENLRLGLDGLRIFDGVLLLPQLGFKPQDLLFGGGKLVALRFEFFGLFDAENSERDATDKGDDEKSGFHMWPLRDDNEKSRQNDNPKSENRAFPPALRFGTIEHDSR